MKTIIAIFALVVLLFALALLIVFKPPLSFVCDENGRWLHLWAFLHGPPAGILFAAAIPGGFRLISRIRD